MKYYILIFIYALLVYTNSNAQQTKNKKFTLVIDAGHGGHDPGCHGAKNNEKDVALAIALKLGTYVEENCPDVKVVYTRKTDIFLELNERAQIANNNNADLFICIHCNASANKKVFGSETYVMGLHKTKGNLDVARRENASILLENDYKKKYDNFDPNSDEAHIIFTMYQNAFLDHSLSLADKIQKYYTSKACRTNKGVKQAGFLVLWKTSMPSLLTETGFLTNPQEEKFLGSKKGQDYMAQSIFLAFRKYKDEVKSEKKNYTDELENTNACGEKLSNDEAIVVEKDTVISEIENSKLEEQKLPEPIKVLPHKVELKKEMPQKELVYNLPRKDTSTRKSVENTKVKLDLETVELPAISEPLEPKIIFKVQFYNSAQKLSVKYPKFKGLKNITELKIANDYKYFTGEYTDFKEALEEQKSIRKKGFKDAFVVAFEGDKKITTKEALEKLNK